MNTCSDESSTTDYSFEFLQAARYGVLDDLQLMVNHPRLKQIINFSTLVDKSKNSPLMLASANGYLDCVTFLIENNVSVPVIHQNESGNSALHWAALNGHVDVVEYLIANGADVTAVNVFGKTAFDEALVRDRKDCCEIIAKEECRLIMLQPEDDFNHHQIGEFNSTGGLDDISE